MSILMTLVETGECFCYNGKREYFIMMRIRIWLYKRGGRELWQRGLRI